MPLDSLPCCHCSKKQCNVNQKGGSSSKGCAFYFDAASPVFLQRSNDCTQTPCVLKSERVEQQASALGYICMSRIEHVLRKRCMPFFDGVDLMAHEI